MALMREIDHVSREEPVKTQVRVAFAESIKTIWQVMLGIACLGFVVSLAIKSLPLTMETDENWGMEETKKKPTKPSDLA